MREAAFFDMTERHAEDRVSASEIGGNVGINEEQKPSEVETAKSDKHALSLGGYPIIFDSILTFNNGAGAEQVCNDSSSALSDLTSSMLYRQCASVDGVCLRPFLSLHVEKAVHLSSAKSGLISGRLALAFQISKPDPDALRLTPGGTRPHNEIMSCRSYLRDSSTYSTFLGSSHSLLYDY